MGVFRGHIHPRDRADRQSAGAATETETVMTTPSGYPVSSNEPYGAAGQYPTGPGAGYNQQGAAGPYPPAGQYQQPGDHQQGQYPAPNAYRQYPAAPPGYPAPNAYGAPVGSARPGMVTAAAVLAFVWGGLGILFGLLGLAAGSVLSSATSAVCNDATLDRDTVTACNAAGGLGSFLIIVTICTIVIAGLMIWGGVVALNGKNGQILVIACGIYAALAILSVIASSFGFTYLLGFVIPALIVVFLLNAQSKAWFKAKGGKTF
jgi:hypothetical protein